MKNSKLQNPSLRKRKGFTLIELIVVIAILAILAAIAIPTFIGTLAKANERTLKANQRIIASAVSLYLAENSALPATTNNLDTYIEGGGISGMAGDPTGASYSLVAGTNSIIIRATTTAAGVTAPADITISGS